MKFTPPLIKAFFIFPMNIMGTIPGFLLWSSREGGFFEKYPLSFELIRSFPGGLLIGMGASLCWVAVSLFSEYGGGGTPAPYDPPKFFVARGVYRHVRNPMMIGVILVLLGEAMLSGSLPVFTWALIFFSSMPGFNTFLGRTRSRTQVWRGLFGIQTQSPKMGS